MKRIAPGYYTTTVTRVADGKAVTLEVTQQEKLGRGQGGEWYFKLDGGDAEDTFPTKRDAEAAGRRFAAECVWCSDLLWGVPYGWIMPAPAPVAPAEAEAPIPAPVAPVAAFTAANLDELTPNTTVDAIAEYATPPAGGYLYIATCPAAAAAENPMLAKLVAEGGTLDATQGRVRVVFFIPWVNSFDSPDAYNVARDVITALRARYEVQAIHIDAGQEIWPIQGEARFFGATPCFWGCIDRQTGELRPADLPTYPDDFRTVRTFTLEGSDDYQRKYRTTANAA